VIAVRQRLPVHGETEVMIIPYQMMQMVRMELRHYCPISDKVPYLLDEKQDMLSGPFSERYWFTPMSHM
jgi:hypothetical protein